MGKSVARKRKRQYYGNQHSKHDKNSKENSSITANASVSALKIKPQTAVDSSNQNNSGNRIFDLQILLQVIFMLACPKCFCEGLILAEDSRYGLCSNYSIKCQHCDYVHGFSSSKKSVNSSEINSRLVYGMRQIGKGFSSAYKFCATLNIPMLSNMSYRNYEKKLLKAVHDVAEKSMDTAASEIVKTSENSECGVSVDGTWQRRGHTSLNGCVSVISIDTGKVIDLEVISSYCPVCKKLFKMPRSIEYESAKADHRCQANFEGSSSKMEIVGAMRIFQRSEEKRQLKYTQYYGDGDSKGFLAVQNVYGENTVTKLECIGHVQKRVGSRLRKLKANTKGLSGKGKLTDAFIDKLQNYYGIAIRNNVNNIQGMQQSVIAALFHCASSRNQQMHGQCPTGENSWCYFQRAKSSKLPAKEKYSGLPNNILNIIKPTYLELCSRQLLEKCLHGKTQNNNECFNGILWQRIPKNVIPKACNTKS